MLTLPEWIMPLLLEFAPIVRRKTTWDKVEIIIVGAMLATVLRVMGLSQERLPL